VEQFPKMEGRQMVMMLSPKKTGKSAPGAAKTVAKPAAATAQPVAAGGEKK
jgi:hypothetical protein